MNLRLLAALSLSLLAVVSCARATAFRSKKRVKIVMRSGRKTISLKRAISESASSSASDESDSSQGASRERAQDGVTPTFYHSNAELVAEMRRLAAEHPKHAYAYSIGQSEGGTELWVLAIAAKSAERRILMRPEVKLVANMHGDETVGRELLLSTAKLFLRDMERNASIGRLMKSMRIHLMPTMNPDGFENSNEGECRTGRREFSRTNSNGIDLNRNFPDLYHRIKQQRQKETRAVMAWSRRLPFILSANFHGGALVVNYPFDTEKNKRSKYSRAPDDDVLRSVAKSYARSNPAIYNDDCGMGFQDGITNGADWYYVHGSMQDFNYGRTNALAVTLEVSCCKFPLAEELPSLWEQNKDAIVAYLDNARFGIRGLVVNAADRRKRLAARIRVEGRGSFKTTRSGEFWRILLPGTYMLKVSSPGFKSRRVRMRLTEGKPVLHRNIGLRPLASRRPGGHTPPRTAKRRNSTRRRPSLH